MHEASLVSAGTVLILAEITASSIPCLSHIDKYVKEEPCSLHNFWKQFKIPDEMQVFGFVHWM